MSTTGHADAAAPTAATRDYRIGPRSRPGRGRGEDRGRHRRRSAWLAAKRTAVKLPTPDRFAFSYLDLRLLRHPLSSSRWGALFFVMLCSSSAKAVVGRDGAPRRRALHAADAHLCHPGHPAGAVAAAPLPQWLGAKHPASRAPPWSTRRTARSRDTSSLRCRPRTRVWRSRRRNPLAVRDRAVRECQAGWRLEEASRRGRSSTTRRIYLDKRFFLGRPTRAPAHPVPLARVEVLSLVHRAGQD